MTSSSPSPCEFPRCAQAAQFCFIDEPSVACFCTMHKDDTMVSLQTCEFLCCSGKPLYTFTDDIFNPHFCAKHKSHEMILTNGVSLGAVDAAAPATPPPTSGPSHAFLELAYNYFSIKPEYDALESAKNDAAVHQAKLDNLKSHIKGEVASIHKTSQSIEKLEKNQQPRGQDFELFWKIPLWVWSAHEGSICH